MIVIREAPSRLCLPPVLESGPVMRQAVLAALMGLFAGPEEAADMVLAASEAFNNAIRHGSMGAGDQVGMAIETVGMELTVSMEYRGEPFMLAPPTLPEATDPHGRGRYLMEQLTDQVSYEFFDEWTRVRLCKRIWGP